VNECRTGQVVATIIAGTAQLGVQSWMFTNIPDLCSTTQKDGFTCPNTEVFGTASFVWGVIGPQRQFSPGQVYHGAYSVVLRGFYVPTLHEALVYFFFIGVFGPFVAWLIALRWPNSFICYVKCVFSSSSLEASHKIIRVQLPRYFRWSRDYSANECGELRSMGYRRIHLSIRHPAQTLLVVGEVQL